jgi:hypothetical protein
MAHHRPASTGIKAWGLANGSWIVLVSAHGGKRSSFCVGIKEHRLGLKLNPVFSFLCHNSLLPPALLFGATAKLSALALAVVSADVHTAPMRRSITTTLAPPFSLGLRWFWAGTSARSPECMPTCRWRSLNPCTALAQDLLAFCISRLPLFLWRSGFKS